MGRIQFFLHRQYLFNVCNVKVSMDKMSQEIRFAKKGEKSEVNRILKMMPKQRIAALH